MCILLLFNEHAELSFKDIKEAMKFEDDVCKKNLFSLMFKNSKILQKITNQESKSIKDDDIFGINQAFTSAHKKVVVPVPVVEVVYQKDKVMNDRGHAIEAAIVRIMKNRK